VVEDADWVLSHLRPLVGRGDSPGTREEAFAAWRRLFESMAEEHPLVLVFEDIQWADDGLLDFIDQLADWARDVPILILCTARLELLERRPTWGGGKVNAATVALSPLSDEDTAKLIWALGAETPQDLLERCGGNPLYAEQYVRMLAERGSAEELPETVQGIIAARLDSLPGDEKALLQSAAVVGKVFWLGALGTTEQQLHPLQQKEFLQRARRSSVEGQTEYAFKHLLVRDVAYGQVPRVDRAQKHLQTAEWIESLGRPDDHAEMVAHHYASALELMRAARQHVDGVGERARVAFRDAGDRAAKLNALSAADRYYADALALTPPDDPERAELLFRLGTIRRVRLEEGGEELEAARDGFLAVGETDRAAEAELGLAQVAWRRGRTAEMREHMAHARSLVAGTAASEIQAAVLTEASRYAMLAGEAEEAVATGREAIRLAEQLGLDELRANALNNVGSALGNVGDPAGMVMLEESISLARRINSVDALLRGLNNLGTQHVIQAELAKSDETIAELRAVAERYGYGGFLRFVEGGSGVGAPYQTGDWETSAATADAFLATVEAGSPHYQAATAYAFRAQIRLARDDVAGALSDAERAYALGRQAEDPQSLLAAGVFCGLVYERLGDARGAELLDAALTALGGRDMGWAIVVAAELAWLARSYGRADEVADLIALTTIKTRWIDAARAVVEGDLRAAADILDDVGARPIAAFFRMRAAEELVAEGRRAEADEQLRAALAFYRGVRAKRYVREGEALLAASA